MSSTPENSDPYLYPGTNVLKNLRGLTDPEQLERCEARRSHQRIAELMEPQRFVWIVVETVGSGLRDWFASF
ncbi:MAG: hypothetical protein WBE37_08850 [Bryobacteraceae bacterium]